MSRRKLALKIQRIVYYLAGTCLAGRVPAFDLSRVSIEHFSIVPKV